MKVKRKLDQIANDKFLFWHVKRPHNMGCGVKSEAMGRVHECLRMLKGEVKTLRPLVNETKDVSDLDLVADWLPMAYDSGCDIYSILNRCAEILDEINERIGAK